MKSYKYKEQTKEHNTHLGRSQGDKSLEINIKTDVTSQVRTIHNCLCRLLNT